jgi:GT2 family glycosyltransferase
VSVAGVVVVHEPVPELSRCLEALIPQVDELVVVDNLGRTVVQGVPVLQNERPAGFAANANRGIAETSAPFVVVCNPDTEAAPDAVAILRNFAERHPRAGIVAPALRHPDGSLNPSRRRFPTIGGTVVRRTPLGRVLGRTQRGHYGLDEQPDQPAQADWLLGAFLLLRREMLDELGGFDDGYRPTARTSTSRTARRRQAGSAGTSPRRRSSTPTRQLPIAASSPAGRGGTGAASRGSSGSIRSA